MISTMPYCGECGYDSREHYHDDHLCDSCGADLQLHGYNVPHHHTVDAHIYVADEMKIAAANTDFHIFNVANHVKQTEIASAEYDMLADNLANDSMDTIQLNATTGLVMVFNTPVHLLETLAGVYDPLASPVMDPAFLTVSKDTTDGINGTWTPVHQHVYDFLGDKSIFVDDPIPGAFHPLLTNIEGVKGVTIIGNGTSVRYLCEFKVWIPKVPAAADESPCDRMPTTAATKPILITFLEEEWGHDDDAVSHMTKAELWSLIHTHCD